MSGKSAVSAKVTPSDWQTPELLRIILARTNPQSSASAKGMVQSIERFLDGIGLPLAPGTSRLDPTGEPESLVPFSATRRVREKEGETSSDGEGGGRRRRSRSRGQEAGNSSNKNEGSVAAVVVVP